MAYKRISPQPVVEGGTGAQTFTTHGVLIGEGTGAISSTTAGTTGQVLTGVTGSDPTFQSPAASSITITGDSGGGLTGNSFTFTGGTTGLTFAGAGTTETLGGDLVVANGGTGRATLTNHGVLVGAGTSAITQLAVGSNGQVLVGSTGADPAFSTLTSSAGSVTYTTGAASLNLDVTNYVATTTWTPVLNFGGATTGITYSTQLGNYAKIGTIVVFSLQLTLTSKGSATGNATITGLPVAIPMNYSFSSLYYANITYATGSPIIIGAATTLTICSQASAESAPTVLTNSAFTNSSIIIISGSYAF